jgi:hypothetical protein
MPLWRALKWRAYALAASVRCRLPVGQLRRPPVFIFGCGRSGTTIIGRIIGSHRRLAYLNEPIHYWHAIDPRTDNIDFFGGKGLCFLDAADATARARARFDRLFGQSQAVTGAEVVVEKFPTHALRIEWLSALCPKARFIHVLRDGRAVCRSIDVLSRAYRYKVIGMAGLNQWWGNHFHKWRTLVREGKRRGLYVEALGELGDEAATDYVGMAAYEWLVSLDQIYASVARLNLGPDRFLEVRYEDFVRNPESCLRQVERLINVAHDEAVARTARQVLEERATSVFDLTLPPSLYAPFVEHQRRLGYPVEGVVARSASQ